MVIVIDSINKSIILIDFYKRPLIFRHIKWGIEVTFSSFYFNIAQSKIAVISRQNIISGTITIFPREVDYFFKNVKCN